MIVHLHIQDIIPKIVEEDRLVSIVVSREWFCCVIDHPKSWVNDYIKTIQMVYLLSLKQSSTVNLTGNFGATVSQPVESRPIRELLLLSKPIRIGWNRAHKNDHRNLNVQGRSIKYGQTQVWPRMGQGQRQISLDKKL